MIRKFKSFIPKIPESCYIFPTATIIGDVTMEENIIVYPGAVIRGEHQSIFIGAETNIQENTTVHIEVGYDVKIGRGVTIGHNSIIHGCTIEDNVLIGMGSIIQEGAVIGSNSYVGAGALIKRGMVVPQNSMVYGFPAHIVRPITEEEYREIREGAQEYQVSRREFKQQDAEEAKAMRSFEERSAHF